MTTLSGLEIDRLVKAGQLKIDPYDPKRLNPNSYNLRLSNELLVYTEVVLDMRRENAVEAITIPKEGLILQPGRLYLGSTIEYTETPGYVPVIEGRSSVGRLGLCVHVTAGFGDANFRGAWTLELTVVQPLRVYSGVEVCQIAYTTIQGDVRGYAGKYQGQRGPRASSLWKDFPVSE